MPNLGQVFYGRGPDGYGVLGVSPAGRPFIGSVASLCRAVGSPDRPGEIPTFLLGKREGDAAIMIRACRGAADPTGRATVFFHALVADAISLRSAGLDAFAFAENGTFASACPSRELPDLVFPDVRSQPSVQPPARSLELPATISSDRPLDALVRRELGTESLDKNWATFSYNPLPGFDLCVLSSYSPRTGGGTEYAFDGAGVRRLSPEPTSGRQTAFASPAERNSPKRSNLPLVISLAANVALALALVAGGGKGGTDKPGETSAVVEMSESDARAKWEEQWKSEWEKALPPPASAMTEDEAKATWEAQWKSEWEKALPPPTPDMTEDKARAKWEESWRGEWTRELRADFEKTLRASGGEWPVRIDHPDSPFTPNIRSALAEPNDDKQAVKWRIYRSCRACSDFIQTHSLCPPVNQNP